jgi:uncharacterized protein (DUF305 family)
MFRSTRPATIAATTLVLHFVGTGVRSRSAGAATRDEKELPMTREHPKRLLFLVALGAGLFLTFALAACGNDDEPGDPADKPTEQAFLKAMIPHHESAVEMATVAKREGRHREIKQLAEAIESTQSEEIKQMELLNSELFGEEITPDPGAHEQLGLSVEEAGGGHGAAAAKLEGAKLFDRAFIDEMVPHHQGAIRMARVVLEKGDDPQVRELAATIIRTQSEEIEEMNRWRRKWYGAPSPAGGVPRKQAAKDEQPMQEGHPAGH